MKTLVLCCLLFSVISSQAIEYRLPASNSRVIGDQEYFQVRPGDYFHTIARFYNIGLLALMEANPGIDPFLPPVGSRLLIPIQMILPDLPYRGIIINLPELRLYYFPKGTNTVHVFPIGIGREGRSTPVMNSRILLKVEKPSWTPNARIRAEHFEKYGNELPRVVPPGPNNPMGDYALQLEFGRNNYWIHGTNQNFGIGLRVSAGCIRMNPEDIAWLFAQVNKYDPVTIINQPVKIAISERGEKLVEAHPPLTENKEKTALTLQKINEIVEFNKDREIDTQALKRALLLQQGVPIDIEI